MDTDTLYYVETLIESIQNDTNDLKDIVKDGSNKKMQFINKHHFSTGRT